MSRCHRCHVRFDGRAKIAVACLSVGTGLTAGFPPRSFICFPQRRLWNLLRCLGSAHSIQLKRLWVCVGPAWYSGRRQHERYLPLEMLQLASEGGGALPAVALAVAATPRSGALCSSACRNALSSFGSIVLLNRDAFVPAGS